MKNCTVIGIDTAKNWIQLHGADTNGKVVLKKRLTRDKFLALQDFPWFCKINTWQKCYTHPDLAGFFDINSWC